MNRVKIFSFLVMLVLLGTVAVYGNTSRIGTDGSGNVYGVGSEHMIAAFNEGTANYYLSTSANFLTAIYSLNNTDGDVYAPANCNYTLTSDLLILSNVTIHFGTNSTIWLANSNAGINITSSSDDPSYYQCANIVGDVRIHTVNNYKGIALKIYVPNGNFVLHKELLDIDIEIKNTGGSAGYEQTGIGFMVHCHSTGTNTGFAYNKVHVPDMYGFRKSIVIWSEGKTGGVSYINANDFYLNDVEHARTSIQIVANGTDAGGDPNYQTKSITGNRFHNCDYQPVNSGNSQTIVGLLLEGRVYGNKFYWGHPWDWSLTSTAGQVNITNTTDPSFAASGYSVNFFPSYNHLIGYYHIGNIFSNNTAYNPNYVETTLGRFVNNGSATVSSGQESVTVNHEVYARAISGNDTSLEPFVSVFPAENLSSNGVVNYWIDTITSTQFTIHVDKVATGDITFSWRASLDHYFDDF